MSHAEVQVGRGETAGTGGRPRSEFDDDQVRFWIDSVEREACLAPAIVRRIRRVSGVSGAVVLVSATVSVVLLALGAASEFGLASAERPVVTLWGSFTFALLGLAIVLTTVRDDVLTRTVAVTLGGVVSVLGALFLVARLAGSWIGTGAEFGLHAGPVGGAAGQISTASALCLLLLGLGLTIHTLGHIAAAQRLMLLPSCLCYLAVVGYLFDARDLYATHDTLSMSPGAAVMGLVCALAVLGLQSDEGPMRMLSGATAGGRLVRRLLPVLVVLPLVVAVFGLAFLRRGVSRVEPILTVGVVFLTLLSVAVLLREAGRLSVIDLKRAGTEAALTRLRAAEVERQVLSTDLETTRTRLADALYLADDAIVQFDDDGRITAWNSAATSVYGYSEDEMRGKRIDEVFETYYTDGSPATRVTDGEFYREATGWNALEYSMVRKNGEHIEVETRISAQEAGGRTYFTAIARDVTERRRAEVALRDLNRGLEEFSALAAHDLRGPLSSIHGYAELLRDEVADGGARVPELVDRIDRATDRGLRLVDDLLAYSRAVQGGSPTGTVDLGELVAEAVEDVRSRGGRGFEVEVHGPLPCVVGDPGTLRQVFVNLVANAVGYCPDGRVPHVVVDSLAGGDRRGVGIVVSDNGVGIPMSERERVFEMFQRGTSSTGRQGTGIGLAICRRVLEHHGGTMRVMDAPTGGAAFVVDFPRKAGPRRVPLDEAGMQDGTRPSGGVGPGSGERVGSRG